MKKIFFTLFVLVVLSFAGTSCTDSLSNDITIEVPNMPGDPDEPKPGCDDPNGCDDTDV